MKGRKTDFKERHAAGQPPRVRREEMRKQLLGVFLPLLILGLLAAAAETRSTGTGATKRAALQRLEVTHGEHGISIEITARGQLTPKLNSRDSPARVMLDLPNTVAATEQRHIGVDSVGVKSVRIGMDGQTPPTTRIVVDLVQACRYELVPGSNNKLVLKLQTAVNMAAEQKTQMAQTPGINGPKYTGEPISVNLKDVDLKDFFRLILEISGLNVVLDHNVHGTLTIVLDDVPWDQALDIVLKNNDLARELEGNVLRIATVETLKHEADSRRAQIESEALAVEKVSVTRFLSYAKAKDAIVTVKKFLSQRGDVVADDRTNAVIINDIPKVIPIIDRLLTQLDRKTQEVEIEARVVAATRSFARDIGTQLGFGWGNGHSAVGGAQQVGTTPTTFTGLTPGYINIPSSGSGGATGTQIPLFSNL